VTNARPGPLAGIRVLEVGHVLAGPFGGMLLADLGADVIKVEPIDGDLSRQVGSQYVDEHNVYFASINRNKRSVHIDLTTAEGRAELGALARTAHALLVNMRPSTIRKLGLDYASMRHFNPKLVCVALTGYGLEGEAAEWPAFDYVIQARLGVAALTGEPEGPHSSATPRSTTRRASWRRSASSRRCSKGRAARSTSRSSTSCSRSSTTRPPPI
jgi:crotonobetainyl-CoA:carnitine CoA-transferase CaiB-like acyl-CoA transferase